MSIKIKTEARNLVSFDAHLLLHILSISSCIFTSVLLLGKPAALSSCVNVKKNR